MHQKLAAKRQLMRDKGVLKAITAKPPTDVATKCDEHSSNHGDSSVDSDGSAVSCGTGSTDNELHADNVEWCRARGRKAKLHWLAPRKFTNVWSCDAGGASKSMIEATVCVQHA